MTRSAALPEAEMAAYCPLQTEHDVFNTGTGTIRYVYVVADATTPRAGEASKTGVH
jgi:hypothetical protein